MYIREFKRTSVISGVIKRKIYQEYECNACGEIYTTGKNKTEFLKSLHICQSCKKWGVMDE